MERLQGFKELGWGIIFALLVVALPGSADAGYYELSFGGSYNRSKYPDNSYNWVRRWGLNAGYHFNELMEIEFGFQDAVDRTKITNYEDTTIHDRIYSATWIQSFARKDAGIQPFLKAGIGQLNRQASGFYVGGSSPPSRVDSVTGVAGAGLRIYLTRTFAIRSEATSYLQGGHISAWKDNISFTAGLSAYF